MTTGEVAAKTGVSTDTVRHYERLGLLPAAERRSNGYRQYSPAALRRVQLIRSALEFGFSLKQLRSYFQARAQGAPPCAQVRAEAQRLLTDMDAQLARLRAARRAMARTLADWDSRLAATPAGQPAGLLDHLTPPATRRHSARRPPARSKR